MAIPDATGAQLEQAMDEFDREHRGKGPWKNWPQMPGRHLYVIAREGKVYPIKMIIHLATGAPRHKFIGGVGDNDANQFVKERGFDPVELTTMRPVVDFPPVLRDVLEHIGTSYLSAKTEPFPQHPLGHFITHEGPGKVLELLSDPTLTADGGRGMSGQWTHVPWIGIFDPAITDSATRGYYLVYLFSADLRRVYLSMNQGTTEVIRALGQGKECLDELRQRAAVMRWLVPEHSSRLPETRIDLASSSFYARGYEAGHAYGVSYDLSNMPGEFELRADLSEAVRLYRVLMHRGGGTILSSEDAEEAGVETLEERRQYATHRKIERNPSVSKKVKRFHGVICQSCGFDFAGIYGETAAGYIEAHHLIPLSEIPEGKTVQLNPEKDFAVLCANCHRAIHRKGAPKDISGLRQLPGVEGLRALLNAGRATGGGSGQK